MNIFQRFNSLTFSISSGELSIKSSYELLNHETVLYTDLIIYKTERKQSVTLRDS